MQAEIQALAGDRVDVVGGIADERDARADKRAGKEHLQRPRLTRTIEPDRAKPATDAAVDLGQEAIVRQRHNAPGDRLVLAPGNAGAVAGKRQQRKRSAGQEMLHGAATVGLVVGDRDRDAMLAIGPADGADAGKLAHARVAAFGADQQARGQRAAIAEGDRHIIRASAIGRDLATGEDRDLGPCGDRRCQRRQQPSVGHNAGGRLAIVERVVIGEMNGPPASLQRAVGDLDRNDWFGLSGNSRPDAECREKPDRGGR